MIRAYGDYVHTPFGNEDISDWDPYADGDTSEPSAPAPTTGAQHAPVYDPSIMPPKVTRAPVPIQRITVGPQDAGLPVGPVPIGPPPPEPPAPYYPPMEQGWWDSQSTGVKVGIVGGGLLTLGVIGYLIASSGKSYKPNLRATGARGKAPKGKIRSVKGGRRFGHITPPKRYWKMGARKKADFAWPEGYKYPLIFRSSSGKVNVKRTKAHIRSAKSYFKRSKHLYPIGVRKVIAKNINKASRRFNAGPTKVKP